MKLLNLEARRLISAQSLVGLMYGEHVPLKRPRMAGEAVRYFLGASPSLVWVVV